MSTFRLAHFSDIHLTLPPLGAQGRLLGKRLAGVLSYYVGGRGQRFAGADTRIRALLEDVDAQQVDHALCTGDVTQMSWAEEFEAVAEIFGERRFQPERYTVIPGNHDRYTPDAVAEDTFGRWFAEVAAPSDRYPYVKTLADGAVKLVLLDVARATGLADSSGRVGAEQLARLTDVLTDPSLERCFVIMALHYGLLRADGRPDRPHHGIRDYRALIDAIDRPEVHLDLVVHGHMHHPYVVRTERRTVACVGSATDLSVVGGWQVVEVDLQTGRFDLQRRVWRPETQAFGPSTDQIPGWPRA